MFKKSLLIWLLLLGNYAMGQLAINTASTVNQMIQSFIGGGVTVTNVTYTGGAASRGIFSNGNTTNLGLTNGIVLCTGYASGIPNPASFFMSTNLGLAGDANLNSINNGCATYDAAILEFDFVPISDSIKFKYVFGSEEYPNYICSQYQDIFAFFVTGPNPAGGNYNNYNIALIPGTTIPVSVNSVNSGTPGSGFTAGGCLSLAYSGYFVNNATIGGTSISFGGFTRPLVARCKVQPCQTYHLKMAVADGYNGLYDSGVFLQANSFSSNTFAVTNYYTDTILGNNAIEGCSNAIVSFTTPTPVTAPLVISYTIGGTATNGTDYTTLPTTITIPTGQDSVGLIIHPLLDGITEGNETVILNITNGCVTIRDTIHIIDQVNLSVNAGNNAGVCPGGSTTLTATPTGGIAPLTYTWNSGAGSGTPVTVSPAVTTTYVVTVSDHCASTATDNVVITVNPFPSLAASALPATVCNGQPSTLTASGANTYNWMPGSLTTNSITVTPTATAIYSLIGTSLAGCTASTTVLLTVNNVPTVLATAAPVAICSGGSAALTASGANTYTWMPGGLTNSPVTVSPASTTVYTLTGTSANTCTASATTSVTVNAIPTITVSALPASLCSGQSSTLTASGGATYVWMPGNLTGSSITITPAATTTYSVAGVSTAGCTASSTISIAVNALPLITASASPVAICNGQSTVLTASGGNTYSWAPGGLSGASVTVFPTTSTLYTVTGTTGGNCSATATTAVSVTNIDIAISSTPENCGHSDGSATALASGNCLGNYTYTWNTTPMQNSESISNLAAGDFVVTVACSGCTNTALVTIANDLGPDASFVATPQVTSILNPLVSFADNTQGNIVDWVWDLGDGFSADVSAFSHNYGAVGSYNVTLVVTDVHGCVDSVVKTILVKDSYTLFIPNTFTPNSDGVNDVFTPYGINIDAEKFEMLIYDRWGNLQFKTKNWLNGQCEGWNGTLNNGGNWEKAVTGVYVYRIYAGNSTDGYKVYFGEVTLIQ
ncbi:MAG: choice-of-anchor L domain-containing protein [Bacteroidota bacterium]